MAVFSERYDLSDDQIDIQNRIIDNHYESLFDKYDQEKTGYIKKKWVINFVRDLNQLHNDEMEFNFDKKELEKTIIEPEQSSESEGED